MVSDSLAAITRLRWPFGPAHGDPPPLRQGRVRMFEHVVERQQTPQDDLRHGRPSVPDVLGPERPIDAPGGDPADAEPGAVPRLLDGVVLAAPADEAVGERQISSGR